MCKINLLSIANSMDGEKAESFNAMLQEWNSYRKNNEKLEQLAGANKTQEALLYIAQTEKAYNSLNWQLGLVIDGYKDFVQAEVNEAEARYEQAKITLAAATEEQSASMDEVAAASQKLQDLSNRLQDEAGLGKGRYAG